MSDKKKVKEICKKIRKNKRRWAKNLDKKIEKNEHLFSIFVPIIAGILFLVFSILNLTSSIWFDEAYSAYLVRGDFSEIWNMTAQDVHPPFFYFALKMWSSIFGTSDVALRFMSVFFGLIAIIFIFQLVKRWFGTKAASVATIVASISPMFIRYGQEMRMYTMVLAIVFAATYFLTLALEKGKQKEGRKYWAIYAILMAVGMWTHYFSAFMWIAQLVMIIIHFGGPKKIYKDRDLFITLLATYAFAIILFLPWMPSFFNQVKTVQQGFWIPSLSFSVAADFIGSILFSAPAADATSWIFIFGALLIVAFVMAYKKIFATAKEKTKTRLKFVWGMVLLPILVMTILSLPPLTSSFFDRYVLYSIVTIWILIGLAIVLVKEDWLRNSLVVLTLIVAGSGIVMVETRNSKGHISEILAETFIAAKDEEPIIMNSVWNYYDAIFYTSDKHPVYLFEDTVNYEYGSLEPIRNYRVNLIDNSEEFLKKYEKVWYVFDTPEAGKTAEIPEWAKEYRITAEISLDHHTALEFTK